MACTNTFPSTIASPRVHVTGIGDAALAQGYLCDPATKSDLRILAKPGLLLRLSRNLDKSRGFVNGALAVVLVW